MRLRLLSQIFGVCLGVAACGLLATPLLAADWPQFRGPNRDGISKETGLLKSWPKEGPPLLWTFKNGGVGYSGPAVVGRRLYMSGGRDGAELVYAVDLASNPPRELWSVKIGPIFDWKGNVFNAGPSATPTVDGDMIYALGGQGILVCVRADGKEIWRKDLPKEMGAEVNSVGGAPEDLKIGWGFACAPLVDGEQLICVTGSKQGTLAAFDKKTGKVLWQSKGLTDQASYVAPLAVTVSGVRQYIVMLNRGVFGISAKNGDLLWSHVRESPYSDIVASTPLVRDNMIYVTAGPNEGCELLKLTHDGKNFKVESVYANKNLSNYHGGVVLAGDYIYGAIKVGWTCQEWKTGKLVRTAKGLWTTRALGPGSVTLADGHLYCYAEADGSMVLAEATPNGWTEKGRFKMPAQSKLRKSSGRHWTHPVIADGRLYLRDQDLLFCFDIREKQ